MTDGYGTIVEPATEYRGATCRETETALESAARRRLSDRVDRAGG